MKESVYKQYLLAVLLVILAFNYKDRLAFGMVLQDIKADLALSDTQLGFLSGIAFALFYAVMGIPLARWADRGNRVTIITLTTGLWSAAMALCGLAASFLQLLFARAAVAVGEAGCVPPAHSLIADYFGRAERPRAVARYMLGGPISMVLGYFLAGWLNEFYGWRTTFLLLGLPGLGLAVLAKFTLREPRCVRSKGGPSQVAVTALLDQESAPVAAIQPSLKEVWMTLWGNNTTFRHLLLSFSLLFFFSNGIGQWQPTFFIRSYGLETGVLGTWFALIYGGGGLLGTYLGGEWASRYAANNERRQLNAVAIVTISLGVFTPLIYLSPHHYPALGVLMLAAVVGGTTVGPLFATIQTLVPQRMRAMSIAIVYLFANLVGMGLGPLAVGALSDVLRPLVGEQSLRYALLALCPGYVWAGWHLWRASRTVTRDLASTQLCSGPASPNSTSSGDLRTNPAI